MPGQSPAAFPAFEAGLLRALAPVTPYEAVIAENLIAIEWDMLQHRRMRDRVLARQVEHKITEAVVEACHARHEAHLDQVWDAWIEAGKSEEDFQETPFDRPGALSEATELAARAVSRDAETVAAAEAEIAALGLDMVALMAEFWQAGEVATRFHDRKIAELEPRCREVKRDLDALQAARPIEAVAEVS
ncbi:hypothetical protein [Rhodosalinus sp. 5P4]|uniref:hypothetical protein n=1 Tax=Rhodosalinus sp. 5P4 TaxID=3239196 RepID=UPI0035236ED3